MRFVVRAAGIGAALAFAACSPAEKKAEETPAAAPVEETAVEPAPAAEETPAATESAPSDATSEPMAEPAPEAAAPETTETAAAPAAEAAPAAAETTTLASAAGIPAGDATRGKKIFAQCMTCHTLEAGVNRTGPSLHGIIGRKAGSVPGFRYSKGNSSSGIVWTEEQLFTYLENPRATVPGTIMAFVGLKDAQQRADVIAYIKANGGVAQ